MSWQKFFFSLTTIWQLCDKIKGLDIWSFKSIIISKWESVMWNFKPKDYFLFIGFFFTYLNFYLLCLYFSFKSLFHRPTNMRDHVNNMWIKHFLYKGGVFRKFSGKHRFPVWQALNEHLWAKNERKIFWATHPRNRVVLNYFRAYHTSKNIYW